MADQTKWMERRALSQYTDIEWCDSTVNPTTGCDGCELWKAGMGGPCYAGNYHETRMAKALPLLYAPTFDEVRLAPGRMAKAAAWSDLTGTTRPGKPWLNGLPRMVFVADLGDLFSKAVPFDYIKSEVFDVATGKKGSRHAWMLLTKQTFRMAKFGHWLLNNGHAWPANVWAGTSVTTQTTAGRLESLSLVPAKIRFVSLEPQWGAVDFGSHLTRRETYDPAADNPFDDWSSPVTTTTRPFHLVIQGGESSQGRHRARSFDLAWARMTRDQCKDSGVAYFLKQLGSMPFDSFYRPGVTDQRLYLKDHHGGDWSEWPADLRVRQIPKVFAA